MYYIWGHDWIMSQLQETAVMSDLQKSRRLRIGEKSVPNGKKDLGNWKKIKLMVGTAGSTDDKII